MNKISSTLILLISSFCIISCSDSEDPSGATSQLSQVLDQPNLTDDRNNIDIPDIIFDSCNLIQDSTIDNSTVITSSISDNSSILNSIVQNCSSVVRSIVDNSSNVDNSTITDSKINRSFICAQSTIDNSTIDNSTVCNSSIAGGSFIGNGSSVCNSIIDNTTIDNASVCDSIFSGVLISNVTVTDTPTVFNVSSDNPNVEYRSDNGSNISIKVTFSESVFVSGTPRIQLAARTDNNSYANFNSGNSTNILSFRYSVQSGDCAADLDYTRTNSLSTTFDNGTIFGTIKDNSTNEAILTLPSPGQSGSLGLNKDIVIDHDGKC